MSSAPERERPERPSEPKLVQKLRARQAEHKQRGRLYRWTFVAVGVVILGVGIAMLALPGPAFVVIPIGLAILSLEFAWAEHLLEKALVKGEEAKQKAASASPAQKALSVAAAVCAAAAALAAALRGLLAAKHRPHRADVLAHLRDRPVDRLAVPGLDREPVRDADAEDHPSARKLVDRRREPLTGLLDLTLELVGCAVVVGHDQLLVGRWDARDRALAEGYPPGGGGTVRGSNP